MGYAYHTSRQVFQIIEEMKREWRGSSYQLLSRNCHHFSDALCRRLGVAGLPHWVNDLATTGHATADFMDRAYNSVPDAISAVKSGLYLTFAGVPECLGSRNSDKVPEANRVEQAHYSGYEDQRHSNAARYADDRFPTPPESSDDDDSDDPYAARVDQGRSMPSRGRNGGYAVDHGVNFPEP